MPDGSTLFRPPVDTPLGENHFKKLDPSASLLAQPISPTEVFRSPGAKDSPPVSTPTRQSLTTPVDSRTTSSGAPIVCTAAAGSIPSIMSSVSAIARAAICDVGNRTVVNAGRNW